MANLARRENRNRDPWRSFFDTDLFDVPMPSARTSLPAVNLAEDETNYTIEVVAPGFKKKDFKLKVEDDILTISAETKMEKTEGGNGREYSRREYSCNSFIRSFRLPDNAKDDGISAKYTDGVLQVDIPKSEKEVRASKNIDIQ
jgi:HSP20 family protein